MWFRGGIAGDIRFLFKFGTVISCLILIHELQLQTEKLSSLIIALLIFLYFAFNLGEWEWNVQKYFVFKAIGFYQLSWQYKVATVKSFNAEFLLKLFIIRANSNLRNYIPYFVFKICFSWKWYKVTFGCCQEQILLYSVDAICSR